MRKQVAFVVGPAVIPAKAGIQYAAASRLIIGSSAILDRPPSQAKRPRVTFACARMRKGPLLQPRPIVIPAKAGIQYAAASRLIIGSSAILDRPPSRAMTPRVTFACARIRKRFAFVPGPAVIPAKAGIQYAAASRLIISSSAILDRPPSRAMTRRVTFACARMRKGPLLQARPIVIPAKAGIQYAAPVE